MMITTLQMCIRDRYKGLGGKPFFIIASREIAAVALITVEQGKPDSLFLVGG